MYQLNRVTLIGRLTAEPQLKQTKGGAAMALCGVATNYQWKDTAGAKQEGVDYHRVVAFGKLAEQIAKALHKGSRVYIEGKLKTRSWKDTDGSTRYMTEIAVRTCVFMDTALKTTAEEVVETNDSTGDNTESAHEEMPAEVTEVDLW